MVKISKLCVREIQFNPKMSYRWQFCSREVIYKIFMRFAVMFLVFLYKGRKASYRL